MSRSPSPSRSTASASISVAPPWRMPRRFETPPAPSPRTVSTWSELERTDNRSSIPLLSMSAAVQRGVSETTPTIDCGGRCVNPPTPFARLISKVATCADVCFDLARSMRPSPSRSPAGARVPRSSVGVNSPAPSERSAYQSSPPPPPNTLCESTIRSTCASPSRCAGTSSKGPQVLGGRPSSCQRYGNSVGAPWACANPTSDRPTRPVSSVFMRVLQPRL